MTHKCIKEMNDMLAEHNTRLAETIDFSGNKRELLQLSTVKFDEKVRKKPVTVFANYCPFCGTALKGMT